jgi:hypothetical protein
MSKLNTGLQIGNLLLLGGLVYFLVDGLPQLTRFRLGKPAPKREIAFDWVDKAKGLQLIMFYASPARVVEGDRVSICYGVAQAKSVRIDPPIEEITPSLNRCLSAYPEKSTTYTLTATDAQGQVKQESFTLPVDRDPAQAVKIAYLNVAERTRDRYDGHFVAKLCFRVWNLKKLTWNPPVLPPGGIFTGCFYVEPKATTTYSMTAIGMKGDRQTAKIVVDPSISAPPVTSQR